MKKRQGFTMVELFLMAAVFGVGGWIWNAAKLSSCDFELPYRCEVIHGIGMVVPPLSIVTVWFDDDVAKHK